MGQGYRRPERPSTIVHIAPIDHITQPQTSLPCDEPRLGVFRQEIGMAHGSSDQDQARRPQPMSPRGTSASQSARRHLAQAPPLNPITPLPSLDTLLRLSCPKRSPASCPTPGELSAASALWVIAASAARQASTSTSCCRKSSCISPNSSFRCAPSFASPQSTAAESEKGRARSSNGHVLHSHGDPGDSFGVQVL